MGNLLVDTLFILFLILFNGFFTGSEIAIISMKQVTIEELLKKGNIRARLLANLKRNPDRFFATVQIGVTLLSTLASVYGGARFLSHFKVYIEMLQETYGIPYVEEIALGILVFGISYLSLVFGELVPKSLALRYASRFSMVVAYPLYFFSKIFSGFTFLLTLSSNLVLGIFQKGHTSFSETRLHEEEIRHILKEGVKAGSIEFNEQQLISNVFEINDTSAREIMTPRVNLVALPIDAPLEEVEGLVLEERYSRIPIYRESLDKIEGILYTKDYMKMKMNNSIESLSDLVRPVYHVPDSMKIDKILEEMRKRRNQLAIVVDEYGGTAGIVTMEDILEEIVGEIEDAEEDKTEQMIVSLPMGAFLISGTCQIGEFNEAFPKHQIPESEGYNSIAGFVLERAGRFPEVGEKIEFELLEFELLRKVRQKLVQFRLRLLPPKENVISTTEEEA